MQNVQDYQGWRRWGSRPEQIASLHHQNIDWEKKKITTYNCIGQLGPCSCSPQLWLGVWSSHFVDVDTEAKRPNALFLVTLLERG